MPELIVKSTEDKAEDRGPDDAAGETFERVHPDERYDDGESERGQEPFPVLELNLLFTSLRSLMKFPKVPVLLAVDSELTTPLKALVKVAVEGMQILLIRPSES